eukprot:gene15766-17357_t
MAGRGISCCQRPCCRTFWSTSWGLFKGGMLIILYELVGWILFSYVEDNLNVWHCVTNHEKVAADYYYPLVVKDIKSYKALFAGLANKTGQSLTEQQKHAMYLMYKKHYNVPDPISSHPKALVVYQSCLKWYRFSALTVTTIGFGVVTPKSDTGKLLVIPYALIGIPAMLSYMAYIGSIISAIVNKLMMWVHRKCKGNTPIKYKSVKRCFYLFVIMWICIICGAAFFASISIFNISLIDAIYFYFVAFTTIGYGDITSPADSIDFYGLSLVVGLSVLSGLVDSVLTLSQKVKFRFKGLKTCHCCHYEEGDSDADEEVVAVEEGDEEVAVQNTHL